MMSATNHTIVGFYPSREQAERAVTELVDEGFSRDHISVVASRAGAGDAPNIGPVPETGSTNDTGEKAMMGGIAGFIVGIAVLAIPGVGPIIAAGPLAAALTGAAAGAATGGLIGVMTKDGIPKEAAERYSKAIGAGRIMVTVHAGYDRAAQAADVLDRTGAIDVDEPAERVTAPVNTPKFDPSDSLVARQRERERRVSIHPGITGGSSSDT